MVINRKSTVTESLLWGLVFLLPSLAGHQGSVCFDIVVLLAYIGHTRHLCLKLLLLLAAPIITAMCIGYLCGASVFDIMKDTFYFFIPISMIMLGEIWCRRYPLHIFWEFVMLVGTYLAVASMLVNLFEFGPNLFIHPRIIRESAMDMNESFTMVNSLAMIAFAISSMAFLHNIRLKRRTVVLIITALAIYLSGSRTIYVAAIIYLFALVLPIIIKNKSPYAFIAIILLTMGIVLMFFRSDNLFSSFISSSVNEISMDESFDSTEGKSNYRGVEAFYAKMEFDNYPLWKKLTGGGSGATVDVGVFSPIESTRIPLLHNGYLFLLIKFGIIGLIYYLTVLIWMFVRSVSLNRHCSWKPMKLTFILSAASIISSLTMHTSVNALFNFTYAAPLIMVSASLYYNKRIIVDVASIGHNSQL